MRWIAQVGACVKDRGTYLPSWVCSSRSGRARATILSWWTAVRPAVAFLVDPRPNSTPLRPPPGVAPTGWLVSMNDQGHLVVDFRNPDGSRSFVNGTRTALAWAHGGAPLCARHVGDHRGCRRTAQGLVRADGTPGISLLVDGATRFGAAGRLLRVRRFWTPGRRIT